MKIRRPPHRWAVFISVGHLIDLDTVIDIVLASGRGFRLPEPTRLADHLVGGYKRKIQG